MPNTPSPQQNHLINALSLEAQHRLMPHLKLVALPVGKVLNKCGDVLQYAYFPTDSIVSIGYTLESGEYTQVSVVGNEGLVGIPLFMGGESSLSHAVVQIAGSAFRLPGQSIKDEFNRHGEMLTLALRYTQSLISNASQTAACNRHHTTSQQLCRWLLLSHDRLQGNELNMTHEKIADALGVRREGITDAAFKLKKKGAIRYFRGQITILDRRLLEKFSCECYAVEKNESDRLAPHHKHHNMATQLKLQQVA